MKTPVLFSVLCGLILTGCSAVTVQQPAGDKVAELDPQIWEGTWRGAGSFRAASTIRDKAKGVVEIRSLDPKEKKDIVVLTVRDLKGKIVGTVVGSSGEESTPFFRIAVTETYLAGFTPRMDLFKNAVSSGKVPGEIRKTVIGGSGGQKNGKSTAPEVVVLKQFGSAELDQMPLHDKGSATECFEADPLMVLVREDAPANFSGKKKAAGRK